MKSLTIYILLFLKEIRKIHFPFYRKKTFLLKVKLENINLIPIFSVGIIFLMSSCFSPKNNCIQPYSANPFYWQYKGEPLLLLGGSDDDNLFQWEHFKLINQLDLLVSAGGNYVRNTMSSRDDGNLWPFARLNNGRFDLDQWDNEYWQHLEDLLKNSLERDIIVQIELWDPHDYYQLNWENSCYNPENNINYTFEDSGLAPAVDWSPVRERAKENPFFHTIYPEKGMELVRYYQERFVEKILEISFSYPNVLYCISNETANDISWSQYWLDFIREKATLAKQPVYIGEMLVIPSSSVVHEYAFDFADLSQSASGLHRKPGSNIGEGHFKTIVNEIEKLKNNPAPVNSVKQYGSDLVSWTRGSDEGVERFWRSIFAGQASVRFHRPDAGLGLNVRAQANIKSIRMITNAFNLKNIKTHQEIESLLTNREDNEAYLIAEEGKVYSVFFTSSGKEVELDISKLNGEARVRWLNPNTAEWLDEKLFTGNVITLTKPGKGQWVVKITSK